MRWDAMRIQPDGGPGLPAAGPPGGRYRAGLFERSAITRTFDTPGFRGMTFFEVHAKSIINRVPRRPGCLFRWTINPYRGCISWVCLLLRP